MADPRIYQVRLGDDADASAGLTVARRFLAACGKPPVGISVWASLAPSTLPGVAALLPQEILSTDITLEPRGLASLTEALRDEHRVHNWFLVQRASPFGAALGVGTPHPSHPSHPSQQEGRSATVSLDFGDDPVPEAIENGRFGRWLSGLAMTGLLPATAAPARLMERFSREFPARAASAAYPARTSSPGLLNKRVAEGGVGISARGWRTMRGDRHVYWPGACQLTLPLDPVDALDHAAPLFSAGGPVEFHGYYSSATLGRTGLAARLAAVGSATFVLHANDSGDCEVDDATVDALLAMTGEDLVCVDWRCDWPEAAPGYNGVQLTVNGVGNLHDDDPEHVPGATTVYLTIHPRRARDVDAFASRLVSQAGLHLSAI
jgi:hypothetical protein